MRQNFAKSNGLRGEFTGEFKRFGAKPGSRRGKIKLTVLLLNIKDSTGKIAEDHLWFTCSKQFKNLQLAPGDLIAFTATITPYEKGCKRRRNSDDCEHAETSIDYQLSFPMNVRKVIAREISELPLFASK